MKKILLLLIGLMLFTFLGCAEKTAGNIKNTEELVSFQGDNIVTTKDLLNALKKSGYDVNSHIQVGDGILAGILTVAKINGVDIGIYEYKNNQEMEKDALQISNDGTGLKGKQVDWISIPHFFKKGNIIIYYCGKDTAIIGILRKLMGSQFAGM